MRGLYEQFVRVRVTNMRGVDLTRWRFDWDLTFAVVAAHPDGTILHRYGGRDERGADHWLGTESLTDFLEAALASHALHEPVERPALEPRAIEDVPVFAARDKGDCVHCHSVFPSLHAEAREQERWEADDLWVYPPPGRIGLDLDRKDQQLVTSVGEGSPAAQAGLRRGDRVLRVGDVRVATASDLMHALHELPAQGGEVPVQLERGEVSLELEPGWKLGTPLEFSWRPSKWGLLPAPGFGGPVLKPEELRAAGLAPQTFAFRINYLVTWGENSRLGQAAQRRGLRKGQIVLGTSQKRDFASIEHFHAWWRLTRAVGEEFDLILWEDGQERAVPWTVIE